MLDVDSPADAVQSPLVRHIVGYRMEIPAGQTSDESLPPISFTDSNAVDVGKGADLNKIPPVKNLEGNRGRVLNSPYARNEIAQLAPKNNIPSNKARDSALAAWKKFKSQYSREAILETEAGSSFFAMARQLAEPARLPQNYGLVVPRS
jgi:hypothetical protein